MNHYKYYFQPIIYLFRLKIEISLFIVSLLIFFILFPSISVKPEANKTELSDHVNRIDSHIIESQKSTSKIKVPCSENQHSEAAP